MVSSLVYVLFASVIFLVEEVMLAINYKKAHNEYTKTRVADQSGNFIVHTNMTNSDEVITPTETPDPALKNFEPILYSADNKFGENSLHFDGSHYCYLNDRFHVFNFAQRSFSIEAWVKFDQSAGNKVHTIMSKWTNDIASLDNRIFRFLNS